MAYGNRGGCIGAALLACATATFAQTNQTGRARDDRTALVNLAIQAVQQVQAQEQINLRAVHDTRQEVVSLHRLVVVGGLVLGAGMLALIAYVRKLARAVPSAIHALPSATAAATAGELLRRAAVFEQAHRLEDALACYEQALARDASLTEAYVGKGRVLNQLERYREALACFERASH